MSAIITHMIADVNAHMIAHMIADIIAHMHIADIIADLVLDRNHCIYPEIGNLPVILPLAVLSAPVIRSVYDRHRGR